MAKLQIQHSPDHQEHFDLTSNRILVGQSPDNQLVLTGEGIAPAHASLEHRQGHWILQDLGSEFGTQVNGQTVDEPYHLRHGVMIEVGSVTLEFHDPDEVQETAVHPISAPTQATDENGAASGSGRLWFASTAVMTFIIVLAIIIFMTLGHYFELFNLTDLFS